MNHEEMKDQLAPFALGILPEAERPSLVDHLKTCAECRRELHRMRSAADTLAQSIEPIAPPSGLKSRVMEHIRPTRRSFAWAPALALAASVLVFVGLSVVWRQRSTLSLEIVSATGRFETDGRALVAGGQAPFGQRLTTGEDSTADIRLASQFALHLNPGSEAVIAREGNGYVVSLEKGGVLSVVKTGTSYAVKTNVVTASALGTVFYVQKDSTVQTSVCICHGRFHLEAPGFSHDMEGQHHNATGLLLSNGVVGMVPHAPLAHSDKEIDSLSTRLP